jgi:hypothetical protein
VADRCDLVTSQPGGAGLVELIDQLVADDLAEVEPRLARRRLLLGHNDDGELAVPAYGANLLLAGPSAAGKSTLAAGLLERLRDHRYQFLVLDPEGDHADLDGVTHLGGHHDPRRPGSWSPSSRRIPSGRWWRICLVVGWRTCLGSYRAPTPSAPLRRERTG